MSLWRTPYYREGDQPDHNLSIAYRQSFYATLFISLRRIAHLV